MDRIRWLKFFLYLTDVDDQNGPHVFVEGTHKTDGIPQSLLKRGYSRILDHEVDDVFPPEKIKIFKYRRGSIFVEDTRGLHKGTVLTKGFRKLLQVQYNVGLFGTADLKPHRLAPVISPQLKKMIQDYPHVYSNFKMTSGS